MNRLQELCDVLAEVPDDDFNLREWPRCPVGWYVRERQPVGLWLVRNSKGEWRVSDGGRHRASGLILADHFGIRPEDSRRLFFAESYGFEEGTRRGVLARIRGFVAAHNPAAVLEGVGA